MIRAGRSVTDLRIQVRVGRRAVRRLARTLGLAGFARVALGLARRRLRGEPYRGLPAAANAKERLSRAEARDAILLYRVLRPRLGEPAALTLVGEIIYDAALQLFDYLLDPIDAEALRRLPEDARFDFVTRNLERFPNAEADVLEAGPARVAFTVTHCHLAALARAAGHPELAPLFCAADGAYFEQTAGLQFARATTLAEGGPNCPFVLAEREGAAGGP